MLQSERTPSTPRKSRFSDRLERRRGLHDAEMGRAPASRSPAYTAGYAEGRRRRPRRELNVSPSPDTTVPSTGGSRMTHRRWAPRTLGMQTFGL